MAGVVFGPGRSVAAPAFVRLSATEDPSTSMGVAWTTLSGPAETTVEYGTAKGSYTKKAKGKATNVSATLGTVSEVTLTGLAPDTVYHYRVGGAAGGFSGEYSFRTAPAPSEQCGTLRFAVFGDSRAEEWQGDKGVSDAWIAQSAVALKGSPRFILHGGDIVHDGDAQKQWVNHLKGTEPVSALVPIMYTIGNHDTGPVAGDGANYNRIFHLPRADKALGGSGTEDYYFFTWGNAIFVSLSTESFSGGTPKFKDQADWLDKVLTQNPKRWRFVILHRPIYTHRIDIFSLDLGHPPDEAGQNAALVPVITKHHVDIVLQSHNHFYERYAPSKCQNGGSNQPCPVASFDQGTVHITTGGAGAFRLWCFFPAICPGPTNQVRLTASSEHHWLQFDVKDHTLSMTATDINGQTIDAFTIKKTVQTPDPCAVAPPPDAGPPPDAAVKADTSGAADAKGAADTGGEDTSAADTSAKDTTTGADTKTTPPTADGCGCRVGRAGAPPALALLGLFAALGLWARRRSAKGDVGSRSHVYTDGARGGEPLEDQRPTTVLDDRHRPGNAGVSSLDCFRGRNDGSQSGET
jgi:MYXO-CTERM domain-containing protein